MKTVRTWCIRILMILFTVIFLYPLFWNLMSAFKTNAEYLTRSEERRVGKEC